jgi:hypothetical protein
LEVTEGLEDDEGAARSKECAEIGEYSLHLDVPRQGRPHLRLHVRQRPPCTAAISVVITITMAAWCKKKKRRSGGTGQHDVGG